ncbi:regulatory protein GemA [Rhizobium sp. P38BS-XIX]|uniref:regulatory protein GemA n=1 Tax=Rhizobium sp. P38BS-XIX TaxID=2726740 RepID=UPI00145679D4|nr:regulatory protein GemA [Rhizobium sp. P38BS-XIX]NLS00202.1 regulatory protein GemA [Rhizobium sp. P38BS-XIX]
MTSSIAAIHAGFKQLGISDDADRRALYARITGKAGLTLMKPDEQKAVVTELRRLGFKPAERRANGRQKLTGKFAKKLQALWIAAWNLGIVRDRDDKAMLAFVKRQTGIDHTRFLVYADDAAKAIDGLKGWLKREAGVGFGNTGGYEWLAKDGAKIAWAQWMLLHPSASLIVRKGFDEEVAKLLQIKAIILDHLKPGEWQIVMNALGERIRAGKAGS